MKSLDKDKVSYQFLGIKFMSPDYFVNVNNIQISAKDVEFFKLLFYELLYNAANQIRNRSLMFQRKLSSIKSVNDKYLASKMVTALCHQF